MVQFLYNEQLYAITCYLLHATYFHPRGKIRNNLFKQSLNFLLEIGIWVITIYCSWEHFEQIFPCVLCLCKWNNGYLHDAVCHSMGDF